MAKIIIDTIWDRIKAHASEKFQQIRGKNFQYEVGGDYIKLGTTNQAIPKKHIAEALEIAPLENTVSVQHLRAPSYIYAILMDKRIRKNDW